MSQNDDEPIATINVVPLVDIILVVLIIFMVTAPMVLKPVIDVQLPKASSGEAPPEKPFEVAVKSDGTLSLNGQKVDLENLGKQIALLSQSNPDQAVILQADKITTLERLTEVIDRIKSNGIKKVSFSVEKR